ncbi:hypothetical protein ACVXG7_23975 [Enterobacter hormaechei]
MTMGAYLIRRLLLVIPTLWAIITINFFIVQIAPGGPVEPGDCGNRIWSRWRHAGGGGEGMGPAMPGRAWATSAKATTGAVGVSIRR